MIVNVTVNGLSDFKPFQKQKTEKLQGYALVDTLGARYPINVTMTDAQYNLLNSALESGKSITVTLEIWPKTYESQGEVKAVINAKYLSIT